MPKIVFDTSIGTTNLGDHIIMDSVNQVIDTLVPDDFVINLPTHYKLHPADVIKLRKYDTAFVGGTNLLKNNTLTRSQWKVGLKELPFLRNKVVLLGVGWWQYQHTPVSPYTRFMYKNLLSKKRLHAVRDNYTKEKLNAIGIHNVVNTGCPTVWELDEAHCAQIVPHKRDIVVTTITDYMRDPENDRLMLSILKKHYKRVCIWIQGDKDIAYANALMPGIEHIAPKLSAFDHFLRTQPCEYVGTRLHAGIRALQQKRKAIIIGIDNRAIEMRNDIGLPVLERQNMKKLEELLFEENRVRLHLDHASIERWKANFSNQIR